MIVFIAFAAGLIFGGLAVGFFWWCYATVTHERALDPLAELGALAESLDSTEIDAYVHQLCNSFHDNKVACLAIVVVVDGHQRFYSFGNLPSGLRPDENTVFELASIGKTFTTLLLADMVLRGEVTLETKATALLPESIGMSASPIQQISLKHLATHSSGLPSLPSNMPAENPLNPYVDYTVPLLLQELSNLKLQSSPGRSYAYSNLGFGLLGQCLSNVLQCDYEKAVVDRICRPLGMDDTRMTLSAAQKLRIAQPHNGERAVEVWEDTTMAGAGSFLSTPHDMAIYIRSHWDKSAPALAEAIDLCMQKQHATDQPHRSIGLGWHIDSENALDIAWHNGGSGGSRCYVAMLPDKKLGIGVFANWSQARVEELGRKLLYLHLRIGNSRDQ